MRSMLRDPRPQVLNRRHHWQLEFTPSCTNRLVWHPMCTRVGCHTSLHEDANVGHERPAPHTPAGAGEKQILTCRCLGFYNRLALRLRLLHTQGIVSTFEREEHVVRAPLDDRASLEHENLVDVADGAQPVGDHEHGAAALRVREGDLQSVITACIFRDGHQ